MSTINNNLAVSYKTKSAKEIFNNTASGTKKQGMLEKLKDQSGHTDDETACCLALTLAAGCLLVSAANKH